MLGHRILSVRILSVRIRSFRIRSARIRSERIASDKIRPVGAPLCLVDDIFIKHNIGHVDLNKK